MAILVGSFIFAQILFISACEPHEQIGKHDFDLFSSCFSHFFDECTV